MKCKLFIINSLHFPPLMFYKHVHIGISEMQLVPILAFQIQQTSDQLQMLHLIQILQIGLEVEFVSVLQTSVLHRFYRLLTRCNQGEGERGKKRETGEEAREHLL